MTNEQEEAIEYLEESVLIYKNTIPKISKAIETVLQALESSISKEIIKGYLKEEQERFEVYKKGSKTNENLKLGMWKHLGAKNMCEKILGIEKNIVTLD